MKKAITLILSLVLIFSLCLPAAAVKNEEHPTIYVLGARVTSIHAADGTQLFPNDSVDAGEVLKEYLKPCLEKLAVGILIDDYEEWAAAFHEAIMKVFGELALDGNGEASDGSGTKHPYNHALPKKTSGYQVYDYELCYDWRLSPLESAELLKAYIDDVKGATGESKVNLLGRCYGANVIQAYLTLYPEHAIENVDDVSYLASSVDGLDSLGALFTADITLDPDAVNNFVDYYMENGDLIENPETRSLITTAVEMLNYISVLGLTLDACELFVDRVKEDIFPRVLKDTFGGYVSYWSMVPAEKYEQARDFVFAGVEDEYAGFIRKIDRYHNEVQLKAEETLKYLDSRGIDFYIVSKYSYPDIPVHESATALSDGFTSVKRQSFSATCANYGEVLSDDYIASLENSKYLSPDHKIDAATCLFPETSYFVKDIYHDTFPHAINSFAISLMNSEATVSSGEYPQYVRYTGWSEPLVPIEGLDEDGTKEDEPKFLVFIRFFTAVLNFIKKLFNGEISLG